MKSVAEIVIVGLIGTFTIVAGTIIPPSVIKLAVVEELVQTYNFEKAQHALLTLFSVNEGDRSVYEIIGTSTLLKKPTNAVKPQFDSLFRENENYCIALIRKNILLTGYAVTSPTTEVSQERILRGACPLSGTQFNTIIVVPYNKKSLVEIIGIGIK